MKFLRSFSVERYLSDLVLLLVGLLIITGGRIGIQATPESEVQWLEAFSKIDVWIGWMIIWMSLDNMFTGGRITIFLLSKTVVSVMRVVLGEERVNAFMKRFEEKEKEVRNE